MKKIITIALILITVPCFADDYVSQITIPESHIAFMRAAISSGKYNCGALTDQQCFDRELQRRAEQIMIDYKGDLLRTDNVDEMATFKDSLGIVTIGE